MYAVRQLALKTSSVDVSLHRLLILDKILEILSLAAHLMLLDSTSNLEIGSISSTLQPKKGLMLSSLTLLRLQLWYKA
jgi:hypothetical protein